MSTPLVFYECTLCHSYLDNHAKAALHLKMQHPFKNKGYSRGTKTKNEVTNQLIQRRQLSELKVSLERFTPTTDSSAIKNDKIVKKKNVRKVVASSSAGRMEIKLDNLKVGEMETLISDLFKASSSSDSTPGIRKSNRKVKERIKRNYGELDSEDEEIIRTGAGGERCIPKNKKIEPKDRAYKPHFRNTEKSQKIQVRKEDGIYSSEEKDSEEDIAEVKPTYCCRICDVVYKKQNTYIEHMKKEHLKNNKYTCPHCERTYFPIKAFNYHIKYSHDNTDATKTRQNQKTITAQTGLVKRITVQKEDGTWEIKEIEITSRSALPKDTAVTPIFCCRICNVVYDKQKEYQDHMRKEHLKDNKYTCPHCQNTYFPLKEFNAHIKASHTAKSSKLKSPDENPQKIRMKMDDGTWEERDMESLIIKKKPPVKNRAATPTTFSCLICGMQFSKQIPYVKHMRQEHLKDNKYTCPHCQVTYSHLQHLNKHVRYVHLNKPRSSNHLDNPPRFECDVCHKKIRYQSVLMIHKKTHERAEAKINPMIDKPYNCPICKRGFTEKYRLKVHFVRHLENNPFKCKFLGCGQTFQAKYNLEKHIALHTNRVFYKCETCQVNLCSLTGYNDHLKKYHSEDSTKPYRKKRCRVKVKSINDLAPQTTSTGNTKEDDDTLRFELESIHLADQIIMRDDDQQDIHIKGEVLSPQKQQRPIMSPTKESDDDDDEQEEAFETSPVNKAVDIRKAIMSDPIIARLQKDNPDILKLFPRHSNRTSHQLRKHKCKLCPWSSNMAFSLKQHMKRSHGEATPQLQLQSSAEPTTLEKNPIEVSMICGSCGYQSKSGDDLTSHIANTHTGKNKFHCRTCGFRFSKESTRDLHEYRVHQNDKRFSCSKCDAKFILKDKLTMHFKEKHDPEYRKILMKTCKCDICDRVLVNKKSYLEHMKLHSDNRKPSICQMCGQACSTTYVLKRHVQSVHGFAKNPYHERNRILRLQSKLRTANGTDSGSTSQPENAAISNETGQEDHPNSNSNSSPEDSNKSSSDLNCNDSAEILGF